MKINRIYSSLLVLIIILVVGYLYFNKQPTDFAKNVVLEKSQFEYLPPENITQDKALEYLLNAEDDIQEMKYSNLSTYFVNDALLKAKRSFVGNDINSLKFYINSQESQSKRKYLESFIAIIKNTPSYEIEKLNYSEVIRLCQLIEFRKKQAYKIIDTISIIEEKENFYAFKKIDSYMSIELIKQAKKSFSEERYEEAEEYLTQANTELDQSYSETVRVKDILKLSKGFFKKYYWQTAIAFFALILILMIAVKIIRKKVIKRKIEKRNSELKTLNNLLIKAQENCYKHRTISESTYKIMSERYKSKMAEIKKNIPVLENLISKKK